MASEMDKFREWLAEESKKGFPTPYDPEKHPKPTSWFDETFVLREQIEEGVNELKGGDHKNPVKQSDGSWMCDVCGAESFDKEQFEQAAEYMHCPGKTLTDYVESDKLAKQITSARESMRKMRPAAEKANESLSGFAEAMMKAMKDPIGTYPSASAGTHDGPIVMDVPAEYVNQIRFTRLDSTGEKCSDEEVSHGVLVLPSEIRWAKK